MRRRFSPTAEPAASALRRRNAPNRRPSSRTAFSPRAKPAASGRTEECGGGGALWAVVRAMTERCCAHYAAFSAACRAPRTRPDLGRAALRSSMREACALRAWPPNNGLRSGRRTGCRLHAATPSGRSCESIVCFLIAVFFIISRSGRCVFRQKRCEDRVRRLSSVCKRAESVIRQNPIGGVKRMPRSRIRRHGTRII